LIDKSEDQIIGKKDFDVFNYDFAKTNHNYDLEVIKNKTINKGFLSCLKTAIGNKWFNIEKIPFYLENTQECYVLSLFTDITYIKNIDEEEKREIQSALSIIIEKQEQTETLKNSIVANISHEIKTPISIILGFTELLMDEKLSKECDEYLNYIYNAGYHLNNLVNDIIEISKIKSGNIEIRKNEFCISDLVQEIFTYYKNELDIKKIDYELNFNDIHVINSDGEKIKQILVNLIDNAIKFTSDGKIIFNLKKTNNEYTFSLTDTGIGIDEKFFEKIFNDFFTIDKGLLKKYQGTGLGLFVSKSFVNFLGGKIWVESNLNKGSTFHFTIPVVK
jgi:signal transduction histidine kinase